MYGGMEIKDAGSVASRGKASQQSARNKSLRKPVMVRSSLELGTKVKAESAERIFANDNKQMKAKSSMKTSSKAYEMIRQAIG